MLAVSRCSAQTELELIPDKERTGKVTFSARKKKSPDPDIENRTGLVG